MTSACLHQPNFLPWAKLIDKVLASDVWVVYDTAQYTKTEFHSRQRIDSRQGPVWLSVPVVRSGRPRFQPLADVELCADHDWRPMHLRVLTEHYRRARYWHEVRDLLEPAYRGEHGSLVEFNLALVSAILGYLGSRTRVVRASSLRHDGDRTDRLIALNHAVGADTHLTSTYGSDRVDIDWDRVAAAGITVLSQEFTHPVYEQPGHEFVAGLSVVDMLCHCGPQTAELLAAQRRSAVALPARTPPLTGAA